MEAVKYKKEIKILTWVLMLNELLKRDTMQDVPSIVSFFATSVINSNITGAWMIRFIHPKTTLKLHFDMIPLRMPYIWDIVTDVIT